MVFGRGIGTLRQSARVGCAVPVLVRAYAGQVLEAERVAALRAEGHSFRATAALLGASLCAVQRALKRAGDSVLPADDDKDDPALFALDPQVELVEGQPFLCGLAGDSCRRRAGRVSRPIPGGRRAAGEHPPRGGADSAGRPA